ncbi:MAG TPA: sugar phosphate isomerase/epimerase, partial [Flavisolibacter sp.]|nr:sugar phosphate isomerase/epimerase [Flavisolibacter sp.]
MFLQIKYIKSIFILMPFCFSLQLASAQQIGLELYSMRNQFKIDVPGTLAKIKSWNIKEIEGGGSYGLPGTEYKKLLKENNLKMISIGVDFGQLSTHPDSAIYEAKYYGASYIVCFWIPHKGDEFTINDIKKAVTVFNKAGKLFKEHGLSLCYHPHGYEFRPYEKGTLFDYLVQHTDSRYVNFEMDVYWVKHPGQDPVALLKKYPGRWPLIHLKDRKPGTEGNQNGRADEE